MKKKTKLSFFSNNNNNGVQAKSSWSWPSCHQPKTHSFRTDETPESWFSNSSESPSFSTASDESGHDQVETIIQGLRLKSERLFFEPGEAKILSTDTTDELPFKETTMLSMESLNPFVDFRESMEEMVEAQGLKDWESLEELLSWYLKVNEKSSHGYILGAFFDILLKLSISSSSSSSTTTTTCCNDRHSPANCSSPLSFNTSSSYSLLSSSPSTSQDTSIPTPCESSLSRKIITEDEEYYDVSS